MISLEDYVQLFDEHGGTDVAYLRNHWQRFRTTKAIFEQDRSATAGKKVLDVGAHWLHQALPFAIDGYSVTAADLSDTMNATNVVSTASAHNIRLISYDDLASATAFSVFPDDSFDVIVFGEILEHITFNPVALWREMYRLLSEGGRIVVTTPNYYAATRRRLRESRVWTGGGAGVTVDEILTTPTHGHHWKEYSRREVERYFNLLSPDFVIHRSLYVEDEPATHALSTQRLSAWIRKTIPPLRSRLHVEIDLPKKKSGIVVGPRW